MERTAPGAREVRLGPTRKNPPTPRLAQRANTANSCCHESRSDDGGIAATGRPSCAAVQKPAALFAWHAWEAGPFQRLASGMFGPRAHWTKQGPGLPIWGSVLVLEVSPTLERSCALVLLYNTRALSRSTYKARSRRAGRAAERPGWERAPGFPISWCEANRVRRNSVASRRVWVPRPREIRGTLD
jgi:hypothetical protein